MSFNPLAEGAARVRRRAERFPVQIPVRYREPQAGLWFEGETENISRSGVLFRTGSVLSPRTLVEMRLPLPTIIKGEAPGEILCKGIVVRTELRTVRDAPSALAVAIQHYRFAR